MRVRNILVFPCGSEVALEVREACRFSRHFHLIGASSADDHGRFVYDDYVGGLPYLDDPRFVGELARVVAERRIDAVVPAMDSAIVSLKTHEAEIGCVVVAPPLVTCETCLSKRLTYEALRGAVPLPCDYTGLPAEELPYPVFAKPEVGYGSRGAARIDDVQSLATHLARHPGCLVLEYLPGEEYTIDCFTDRHGRLLYAAGRTRGRVRNGISVRTEFPEAQEEFAEFAARVNEDMEMRGGWFVQVRRDASGELRLLEVAARPAGSSAASRARGVNLPLLSLFDALAYDVAVEAGGYGVVLDRALCDRFECAVQYGCAYVDYDDCLVLADGAVNAQLVAYLYQCVNRGVEVVLLSRHDGDLGVALEAHRLSGLFDRVVHVGRDEPKSAYVERADAVFIDDSFAEREDVRSKNGIPVFAPDMVQCLMG